MKRTNNSKMGFTVMEIMIVVAIIALLCALALPSFMKSRITVQNNRFIADLRVATGAFEQHALIDGDFPPDAPASTIPAGMATYLSHMKWGLPTTLGGSWKWDAGAIGSTAGVVVVAPSASDARMADIDKAIDDGDLVTGLFRKKGDGSGFIYLTGT